ncbi:uncharacterized protein LOC104417866 [Eucalyptus grandis]|uniref:uncharacterized protein LOC104417866 n=1 Tax=Eucalyptus grandis TaxID=71139 RepID=UPI00192EE89B|nr:uncharacterized protein LOC104417866 [Eucalyptus grandis]
MDREQEERQFLGFFGIVKESIKLIFTWRKIFSQIALAFVLPLSLVGLANIQISAFLLAKIHHDDAPGYYELSDFVTLDTIQLLLFAVVSSVLGLIISVLSMSAVMCTTAFVYSSQSITFGGVMRVLPKAWKRLMTTNLWISLAFQVYMVVTVAIIYLFALIPSLAVVLALVSIFLILQITGSVYFSVISDLARLISVVEDVYGIDAMFKSKNLIKGKLGTSVAISLLLSNVSMPIQTVLYIFVANGHGSGFLRFGVAIICFLFLFMLLLFSPIVQTVFYFVCKSYHHENIDKSPLMDELDVHLLAEYLPPKADDV